MTHAAMTRAQTQDEIPQLTRSDRFSSALVLLLLSGMIGVGLLLKQQTSAETWDYSNREVGIEGQYPAGWLIDERGDYVVRMRDPKARPFKTQYVIDVVPAGGQTSVRNVLDGLTLQRSVNLPAYRVLNVKEVTIGGVAVTEMEFAFVETDPNPYFERLPVVVRGLDRVIVDGNRAVIVTFISDQAAFDRNLPAYERFFSTLRY